MAERNNIEQKYKWDIEAMFPDEALWDQAVAQSLEKAESFTKLSGHLTDSADTLLKAFRLRDDMWQQLEKAYVYARMKRDEDNRVSKYQAMTDKCFAAIAKMSAVSSFFTPELLEAPEDKILGFLNENKDLEIYRFAITETLRQKAHVLSKAEENIMAQLSEVTGASGDIFTMLNNADIKFGTITNDEGKTSELTHGNYITFMESHNREVRKEAFTHMYEAYKNQINTIATAYNYNTKTDVVTARIRKYESAKHAALTGDDVSTEVYDNLIKVVNDNLPVLHRYLNIRKKLLGVDEMKMYDVYVPLIELPKKEVTFEDAVELANRGLAPLGDEYLERMNKGIASRWIDVYENEGKTSGAYSFGSYDSMPYILMNFSSTLKDVFTLVHEMGHSMHSSYTRQYQPFIYGSHSIFTAEVASTVNESLLMRYLLDNETDPEMRKYLLNMYIEEFRTTLFRQTMFAEFEDMTHKAIENGEVLTADWLNENYNALNTKYFGDAITDDEYIKYEWARIPHFYTAFYVYKYATGYSAATAISSKILSEGEAARDNYLEFLKTGDSNTPIELLKIAGVDMSSPEPIKAAMKVFASLVDEFEKLVLA
ncbi:MAG: oligoendopeptidase F [Anaerovoracaceae bacterium]|nr:oligoendopeptidase F [Anaerovoracaceae bacterium]